METDWTDPDGRQAKNVWYASGESFDNLTNLNIVATAVNLFWTTTVSGFALYQLFGSGWSLEGYVISDNGGTSELQTTYAGAGATPSGSPACPPNCCVVCSWEIAAHYRGGHPRSYFPAAPYADLSAPGSNNWGTALVDNIVTKLTAGWDAANSELGSGVRFGTIAASRGGVQLTPPVFYEYLSADIKPRVCTQRRRLGKTGG